MTNILGPPPKYCSTAHRTRAYKDRHRPLPTGDYYRGCRDALERFSWWKDGVQYVGEGLGGHHDQTVTLAKALAEVNRRQKLHRFFDHVEI